MTYLFYFPAVSSVAKGPITQSLWLTHLLEQEPPSCLICPSVLYISAYSRVCSNRSRKLLATYGSNGSKRSRNVGPFGSFPFPRVRRIGQRVPVNNTSATVGTNPNCHKPYRRTCGEIAVQISFPAVVPRFKAKYAPRSKQYGSQYWASITDHGFVLESGKIVSCSHAYYCLPSRLGKKHAGCTLYLHTVQHLVRTIHSSEKC